LLFFLSSVVPANANEVTGHFYQRPTFVDLSVGQSSACAVSNDGEVWCWGSNNKFQVASRVSVFESIPFRVNGISSAIQVSVGKEHACALLKIRRVVCWGSNEFGQLGTGFEATTLANSPFPEYVNGLVNASRISAGDDHTCAITEGYELFCWGSNSQGQIGQLFRDQSRQINGRAIIAQAERVEMSRVVDFGLGISHTCVVTESGYVYCFGSNLYGQLGQGWGIDKSYKPLLIGSLVNVKKIDSSGNSICTTDAKKSLRCWGAGESGQLGNLYTDDLSLPTNYLQTLSKFAVEEFSVGNRSTCAKLESSVVYCWGSGSFGQVGSSSSGSIFLSPFSTIQYPLNDATQIKSGGDFSCVLTSNVWCWGRNNLGQLGQMTSSTFSTYGQINNPRWDLSPKTITHTASDNVISLSWPQIGASQSYARVETLLGKLICQTTTALTCDFIPGALGKFTVVLFLQIKDVNGVNHATRAEYSFDVKNILSAAEAKMIGDSEAALEANNKKVIEEAQEKKLAKLAADLKIAEAGLKAAESKLDRVSDLFYSATNRYLESRDRSSIVSEKLETLVFEYFEINKNLSELIKLYKKF
jgi:alpha-tubulin suppressor-like RCC1 family protein